MSFSDQITEAGVDALLKVVKNGKQKFLCFTHLGTSWVVCVTDGSDLWRLEIDSDELEARRDSEALDTVDEFLTTFRDNFNAGNLSIAMLGRKVTLTVGKGSTLSSFDLFEPNSAEKRIELQSIIFKLAELSSLREEKLLAAEQTIKTLKSQKDDNRRGIGALMDLGPKRGANLGKVKPKKTGMSVVNPTSKKRKAAHGVVFD
ncbi:hypothetical protein ScPMuIL_014328 [Solemya velum]